MTKPLNLPSFNIESLGKASVNSPIKLPEKAHYTNEQDRILYDPSVLRVMNSVNKSETLPSFEVAGPREKIFFDPTVTRTAIVTCGGLCPGINAVIRGLVVHLWHRYKVRNIYGVPYGYKGLGHSEHESFTMLTPDKVELIHEQGGTILGSSRGTPPTNEMVDNLIKHKIDILFTIGGDGTMRGARAISEEIKKRGASIAVVGIPKTIDNDIPFVKRSFGFETAVSIACQSLYSGHTEARGFRRGIGLVKLMGRHSGYITANAVLATGHANFCLIPEVPFALEGKHGLLALLEQRLETRGHALIVVAEGAGQNYFKDTPEKRDSSGNVRLGDIGVYLKDRITAYFEEKKLNSPVRYIDPSYLIRSAPSNPADTLFCTKLAQSAVHAAMAGKTAMLVGYWHGKITHIPMSALAENRQTVNPTGELWMNVLETTGQPSVIG
jgi:6-phosphofructokinase 1